MTSSPSANGPAQLIGLAPNNFFDMGISPFAETLSANVKSPSSDPEQEDALGLDLVDFEG